MSEPLYPQSTPALARKRHELAPEPLKAFKAFSAAVFSDAALPGVTKQLIAVAVAHVTQCPYCIKGHTAEALRQGASEQQIMEAIWVAAEMRAGAAFAHSNIALEAMADATQRVPGHRVRGHRLPWCVLRRVHGPAVGSGWLCDRREVSGLGGARARSPAVRCDRFHDIRE